MRIKHTLLAALLLSALVGCSTTGMAPPAAAPASSAIPLAQAQGAYYKHQVDFPYMKGMVSIPPKAGVLIVDARPTRLYDPGHLPGAISIPDSMFDKMTNKLPADKKALVIFYCEGPTCVLSHQSAAKAEKLGYTNVKVYTNGFPEWSAKGMHVAVSTAHMKKLVDEKAKVVLVDARPSRLFDKNSIPGAISIPDTQFDQNASKLPADKATPLVFFCGGLACTLSEGAAEKAAKLGYTNIKTYPEGEPEWTKMYGTPAPAVAAAAAAPAAKASSAGLVPGKEKGSVTVASFDRVMKESRDSITVVDVRNPAEFATGAIKGAINIPVGEIDKKLASLPKGKPIVFVCATGARSGEAYDMAKLENDKADVWFLDAAVSYTMAGTYIATAK